MQGRLELRECRGLRVHKECKEAPDLAEVLVHQVHQALPTRTVSSSRSPEARAHNPPPHLITSFSKAKLHTTVKDEESKRKKKKKKKRHSLDFDKSISMKRFLRRNPLFEAYSSMDYTVLSADTQDTREDERRVM